MGVAREIAAPLHTLAARTEEETSHLLGMVRVRGEQVPRVTLVTMTWEERGEEIWASPVNPVVEAPTVLDGAAGQSVGAQSPDQADLGQLDTPILMTMILTTDASGREYPREVD